MENKENSQNKSWWNSPVLGVVGALVLAIVFNGSLVGSLGAIFFIIGGIKLVFDFVKNRKLKK